MDSELFVDHDYMPTSYSNHWHTKKYALSKEDQLFLVLCRYQQGFSEEHLAFLFGICQSNVSHYYISWTSYIYLVWGSLNIWPTQSSD